MVLLNAINLHNLEVLTYFMLWLGAVYTSVYSVIGSRRVFDHYRDTYGDFQQGWLVTTTRKDVADYEWEGFLKILYSIFWMVFLFTFWVLSTLDEHILQFIIPYWQIILSAAYIFYNTGVNGVLITFIQPLLFGLISKCEKKSLTWFTGLLCLGLINYLKSFEDGNNTFYSFYKVLMAICWINLRCISYCLEHGNKERCFIDLLSYCFYLPTLLLGPFILCVDFKKTQEKIHLKLAKRTQRLCIDLFRYIFWLLFIEFSLHYVYINALSFQVEMIKSLNNWTLYGYGYCMGQFFHMKYVVMYGISSALSKFEGINTPETPKCIGRIHAYSDMWKYFDRGLYTFLTRYIYKVLVQKTKFFASLFSFTFIFVWHGLQAHIFIWTVLNFIGIYLESFINRLFKVKDRFQWNWWHRLYCMVLSPLLAMSALSNFYFFAGMDVGNIFLNRFVNSSAIDKLVLLFFLYCCCCASVKLKKWETYTKSNLKQ